MQNPNVTWLASLLPAFAPYLLVIFIGAVVGLSEIASTFPHSPAQAFGNRWGVFLILLNGLAAALSLWVANRYTPGGDSLITALAVGFGLPTLMRTKFTVAKQLVGGEGGDLSLNMGWLYDQFQSICKTQIDLALVAGRQKFIKGLIAKYPTLEKLEELAHYVIQERALFTREDVEERRQFVKGVVGSETMADVAKRVTLARFILDTGGPDYVREICREKA